MPADPIRRTIKLGPAAHELRRHVGPTAWVVLEEMLQRSTGDDGHVVARVSIRALASSLGLAKDTVTRAVGRLRDLGVIDASQGRSRSPPDQPISDYKGPDALRPSRRGRFLDRVGWHRTLVADERTHHVEVLRRLHGVEAAQRAAGADSRGSDPTRSYASLNSGDPRALVRRSPAATGTIVLGRQRLRLSRASRRSSST